MGEQITHCLIVGAAPYDDAEFFRDSVEKASFVIAADGGIRLLKELGRTPDLVIGDFDSSEKPDYAQNVIVLPTQKDDTDVLASMRYGLAQGYTRFVLIGCLGGRLDHTLANVFMLRFALEHGAEAVLLDEHHILRLLSAGTHSLVPVKDRYVSLFPYGAEVSGLCIRQAKYTAENIVLDTIMPLGVSNEFLKAPMEISFKKGYLLVVLADR